MLRCPKPKLKPKPSTEQRGVNGFEAKSTGQGLAKGGAGREWLRGSAGEQRITRISWCCCQQLATGNWRLVKKGIRTQLEGSNNVQRTRTRNNYILLCAQAKAAGRQQQQQQKHGQEQPQDADADAP
ncbi:hypothetical protein ACLKA6_003535 [Drosophila palustris]